MIYTFAFEWGETWTVAEDDFNWNVEYWCEVLARHIHFFRENNVEVKQDNLLTIVQISMGSDYFGIVSVSDSYVHVILNGEVEYTWRVEEL